MSKRRCLLQLITYCVIASVILTGCSLSDIKFDTFSDVRWPLNGSTEESNDSTSTASETGETGTTAGNYTSRTYNGTITKVPVYVDTNKYPGVPLDMYKYAIQWDADCTRVANVMKRAEAGESITIACIGGSITEGVVTEGNRDVAAGGRDCYAQRFFNWWSSTFPNAKFNFINAGISGTDSYYGVHRIYDDVLVSNPDLVLVEFSVNDNNDELHRVSYDNLVRKILKNSDNTACMLLFMGLNNGHTCKEMDLAIGQSYGLPMVSYVDVLNFLMLSGAVSQSDLAADGVHPTAFGHAEIGQILSQYLDNIHSIANTCGANVPFTCSPVTDESFAYAHRLKPESVLSEKNGVYSGTTDFSRFGIAYTETADGTGGVYEVIVDGVSVGTYDTTNRDNLGSPLRTVEFSSTSWGTHSVEIKKADNSKGGANIKYLLVN